ncbi:diphosphomevalonate decarboxylase [Aerococcus urinaehominis]|uniref:diphosphomevalonate decarboxylase n=1 Tax=Aerococcus urinaehominis TaxID=128944 RepID=A0A109RI23_9LACT|nr:diphosphomevalonate decarboxylase [Aerococcus urinaehominis]AMB99821.1 diphosphomevalonate decarboxylase [Aerococcus urinaehominis]SDM55266.1 diphosphomevalonate decarboxylase [Aerococcus urinaehominis]
MTAHTAICKAHTNIALIKYWGKRDESLFLPMTSSLSLTLDGLYTVTKVTFDPDLGQDRFDLNGQGQGQAETDKISRFLDLFRTEAQCDWPAYVQSYNFVPTAAGLASSASAFAALAGACRQALKLDMSDQVLSTFARRGSGSATRSVFGGFVEWQAGVSSETSFAKPLDDGDWDIGMVIVALNTNKKQISSRTGMKLTMATSPYYQLWPQIVAQDLAAMHRALAQRDFDQIGRLAEANAMRMHASMLAADPPFSYFEPATMALIKQIQTWRQAGWSIYYTMDAGPNVKILCRKSQMQDLAQLLADFMPDAQIITSQAGPGLSYLSPDQWKEIQDAQSNRN